MPENLEEDIGRLKASLKQTERVQSELDRRAFDLRTLYDVSKDIFTTVEIEPILKNFLLMTTGTFGVLEGFILLINTESEEVSQFSSVGVQEGDISLIKIGGMQLLLQGSLQGPIINGEGLKKSGSLPESMIWAMPFKVESDCLGLLGLGSRLIDEQYGETDQELLDTLVNNLVIAIKNARSFEKIKLLNQDLLIKNEQLEQTLDELKAAMRKVEILESVKANLSKFVPNTVYNLIEKSPTGSIPESKERDVSVLFLDIEGYTRICENLESTEVNRVIEEYFSVFMDAIYANNGDVNETAGDGLMVLFLNEDKVVNAMEAVQTALTIREKANQIKKQNHGVSQPLVTNMGINSGRALVGAAKFESYTGSRWTYTARGSVTNVAARIGSLASNGSIFLSNTTAQRVKGHFPMKSLGGFKLKNVSNEVEVLQIL